MRKMAFKFGIKEKMRVWVVDKQDREILLLLIQDTILPVTILLSLRIATPLKVTKAGISDDGCCNLHILTFQDFPKRLYFKTRTP